MTNEYSGSFGLATKLFPRPVRQHIYNVYGLTRLADEIVDTYRGADALQLLDQLEAETYDALQRKYSTNLIVHAFADTAVTCGITKKLLTPFFASMRMDITKTTYNTAEYKTYIYGSAEVVGLMCLRVFCHNNPQLYKKLVSGARALGSAFQKVNFLRDVAIDQQELQRTYFPNVNPATLTEKQKLAIIEEIEQEFALAASSIPQLPRDIQPAVVAAFRYYKRLLAKIRKTPAASLMQHRVSVSTAIKIAVLSRLIVTRSIRAFLR